MSEQKVADFVLERLRAWNVEHVFGYPGDGINGILAAFGRADNKPEFIQSRHEEMSAFEAVGYAKFTDRVAVCMATSGPGAIHLLNGLYDAKLDHVPVVAIVGQTNRSAMGGSYQQEVDLMSLFKDVASEYLQMVTVPEQLPNVLDRAIRVALAERAPTAIIIPSDVQELEYSPPTHAFKMVPSSLGIEWPTPAPDDAAIGRAADVLNAGEKVAILVGNGARGAHDEIAEVAELLGAGAAKALLGKDVLSDELPWVTGAIGLLGTRPSYELMRDCDTLLTIGSSFPYTQFLPEFDQARGGADRHRREDDRDALPLRGQRGGRRRIGAAGPDPAAAAQGRPLVAGHHREERRPVVGDDAQGGHGQWPSGQPAAVVRRAVAATARQRDRRSRLRFLGQLVCAPAAVPGQHARIAVGHTGHDGPRSALRHRREVRATRSPRHRVRGRRCDADERHGRAHHDQALLAGMGRTLGSSSRSCTTTTSTR